MSYMIEYNRCFLISKEGYTPLWLCGSNNCTQPDLMTGRERNERYWAVWMNLFGASEADMLKTAERFAGDPNAWKKGARFLTGDDVPAWIKSGMKSACKIEDVLAVNHISGIGFFLSSWEGATFGKFLAAEVRTTEELDAWIRQAKQYVTEHPSPKFYACCSDYSLPVWDKFVKPCPASTDKSARFCLKYGKQYLVSVDRDKAGGLSGFKYSSREQPLEMSYDEAMGLIQSNGWLKLKMVKADPAKAAAPHNAVIMIIHENNDVSYVNKVTSKRLYRSRIIEGAKRYSTIAAAEGASKRLEPKFPHLRFCAITA